MHSALEIYLRRLEGSIEMEKTIEQEKTGMVAAILRTRLQLKDADEKNKSELCNAIWSILLVGFFKGSPNISQKEIQLYILKQEKSEGRDRKKSSLGKSKEKREAIVELLRACFEDWKETNEGREIVSRHTSDTKKAFLNRGDAAKHEALVDTIARTKDFTVGEKAALQAYDTRLMHKMGRLLLLQMNM